MLGVASTLFHQKQEPGLHRFTTGSRPVDSSYG